MLNRKIVVSVLSCVSCLTIPGQLFGGELTPFRLPSESQSSSPRSITTTTQKETYYTEFERKAKGLTNGDRENLIKRYSDDQNTAVKKKAYDEAEHYQRLQEILIKLNRGAAE